MKIAFCGHSYIVEGKPTDFLHWSWARGKGSRPRCKLSPKSVTYQRTSGHDK